MPATQDADGKINMFREMFVLFKDPKEALKEAVNFGVNTIKKVEIRVIENNDDQNNNQDSANDATGSEPRQDIQANPGF